MMSVVVSIVRAALVVALAVGLPAAVIAAIWLRAPIPAAARIALTVGVVAVWGGAVMWRRRGRADRTGAAASPRSRPGSKPGSKPGLKPDDAVLATLGIEPGGGELRAVCTRVARQIHNE